MDQKSNNRVYGYGKGGSSTKRVNIRPNLSAAGKREIRTEPATSEENKAKSRRNDKKRGGRGGRGSFDNKRSYIQQEGIFSSGLNNDGRHLKAQTAVGGPKEESSKIMVERSKEQNFDDSNRPFSYEEEWKTDPAEDSKILRDLLADDQFISDMKVGVMTPDVLPHSTEEQFKTLNVKFIKKERFKFPDSESSSQADALNGNGNRDMMDVKPFSSVDLKEETKLSIIPSGGRRQVAASMELRDLCLGQDSDIRMMQIPSSVCEFPKFRCEIGKLDREEAQCSNEVGEQNETEIPCDGNCLCRYAHGEGIGRIKIRKNGWSELEFCGLQMHTGCEPSCRSRNDLKQQSVVMIEMNSDKNQSLCKRESESETDRTRTAKMHTIGMVSKTIVCSHPMIDLLTQKNRERVKANKNIPVMRDGTGKKESEDEEEFEALKKELDGLAETEMKIGDWFERYK